MDIVFSILGRTALKIGGSLEENWAAPRVRALLAALIVHAGRPVPIDTLIGWAWPQDKAIPENPVPTFHTYATRLRRALRRLPSPSTLYASNGSYRLDVDKSLIDYHQFRMLINQARIHARGRDPLRTAECAEHALELWRGRPLDDVLSEPAQAWRTRVIQDEWLPANMILLDALLTVGEFDQVLARLNDLQVDHGHDVGLIKLRMSALHGLSRSAKATAYYFSVRRHLLEDGDEQAADHLRQHHESLRANTPERDVAPQVDPPPTPPRQLPHAIADFVGRSVPLRALDAAATHPGSSGGVVILDGMPGVGKTALAIHWGHIARHRYPDGQFFINLNGFSNSGRVSQSAVVDDFLIALGHAPDAGLAQRSKELLLSRLLANRHTMVILDNARDTAHVQDLIALLPDSLIIITSRQRLTTLSAATGARRVRVEPMPTPEATELLSARLGPHRTVEPEDWDRMIQLCGGLPLVITVLAEHVTASGTGRLSAFIQGLDRRQLITEVGEDGDGSTIPQTFFSWSYQALGEAERRLFRLLGLHPGPDISVDVACACDGRHPTETKRSFGILVGTHLIERPDTFDRYRFHDMLREYAAYRAEQDEPAEARRTAERRMISYYLMAAAEAHRTLYPGHLTAPELPPEGSIERVEFTTAQAKFWLDQERNNLIAAIRFAASHGYHDQVWRLADTTATFLDRNGNYEDSRTVREIAVTSAAAAGDREAEASTQVGLGMVLTILGDHSKARYCLDAGLRFARETGNERGQGSTLHLLGRLEMACGDPAAAVELYKQCLDVAQRGNDHEGLCWTHCGLGEAYRLLNQYDQALLHLHQVQYHAQRIDDRSAHASSMTEIGLVHRDQGDHQAAAAFCEQALAIVETMPIPDLAITTRICIALGEICNTRDDIASAIDYSLRALTLARRANDATAQAHALDVLGDTHAANGEPQEAIRVWTEATDLYDRLGNATRAHELRVKITGSTI